MSHKLKFFFLLLMLPLLLPGLASAQTVNVGAAGNVGGMIVFVAQAKGFFAKNIYILQSF